MTDPQHITVDNNPFQLDHFSNRRRPDALLDEYMLDVVVVHLLLAFSSSVAIRQ